MSLKNLLICCKPNALIGSLAAASLGAYCVYGILSYNKKEPSWIDIAQMIAKGSYQVYMGGIILIKFKDWFVYLRQSAVEAIRYLQRPGVTIAAFLALFPNFRRMVNNALGRMRARRNFGGGRVGRRRNDPTEPPRGNTPPPRGDTSPRNDPTEPPPSSGAPPRGDTSPRKEEKPEVKFPYISFFGKDPSAGIIQLDREIKLEEGEKLAETSAMFGAEYVEPPFRSDTSLREEIIESEMGLDVSGQYISFSREDVAPFINPIRRSDTSLRSEASRQESTYRERVSGSGRSMAETEDVIPFGDPQETSQTEEEESDIVFGRDQITFDSDEEESSSIQEIIIEIAHSGAIMTPATQGLYERLAREGTVDLAMRMHARYALQQMEIDESEEIMTLRRRTRNLTPRENDLIHFIINAGEIVTDLSGSLKREKAAFFKALAKKDINKLRAYLRQVEIVLNRIGAKDIQLGPMWIKNYPAVVTAYIDYLIQKDPKLYINLQLHRNTIIENIVHIYGGTRIFFRDEEGRLNTEGHGRMILLSREPFIGPLPENMVVEQRHRTLLDVPGIRETIRLRNDPSLRGDDPSLRNPEINAIRIILTAFQKKRERLSILRSQTPRHILEFIDSDIFQFSSWADVLNSEAMDEESISVLYRIFEHFLEGVSNALLTRPQATNLAMFLQRNMRQFQYLKALHELLASGREQSPLEQLQAILEELAKNNNEPNFTSIYIKNII